MTNTYIRHEFPRFFFFKRCLILSLNHTILHMSQKKEIRIMTLIFRST